MILFGPQIGRQVVEAVVGPELINIGAVAERMNRAINRFQKLQDSVNNLGQKIPTLESACNKFSQASDGMTAIYNQHWFSYKTLATDLKRKLAEGGAQ